MTIEEKYNEIKDVVHTYRVKSGDGVLINIAKSHISEYFSEEKTKERKEEAGIAIKKIMAIIYSD